MITITITICCTVVVLYGIHLWYDYRNVYVDERLNECSKGYTNAADDWVTTDRYWQIKRTYKNGKVVYKTVKMSR